MGCVAFVAPRFGTEAVGGAEAVVREMAIGLAGRGWEVEVLTTCALDHYTWENALAAGEHTEAGVLVRRFPTVRAMSRAADRAERLMAGGVEVPLDEQVAWLSGRFWVPELFHHLLRHGTGYQAVVAAPYLFWTTPATLAAVPERAVVMPCLHDEPYARLEVLRPVLRDPAMVWFLSEPEHELAHRLGSVASRHRLVGAGVEVPQGYDPDGFRRRHRLERPFLLYAGRREGGKGWDWLVDCYQTAVERHGLSLALVTLGVGEVTDNSGRPGTIVDLGYLDPAELGDAFAAARAYVQPSRLESFSRTIMEAWLAGTPVLARADGEVVAWHCRRSGGGLLFSDSAELAAAVAQLEDTPDQARSMAERGRAYVLDNYSWDSVLDRVEAALGELA